MDRYSTSAVLNGGNKFAKKCGLRIIKTHLRFAGAFSLLVKENHQPGWWFQKALALHRKIIRAKRGTTTNKSIERKPKSLDSEK